jgi:hypothetical protein
MPHRTFTDGDGVVWDAWNVTPTKVERREDISPASEAEDRRKQTEYRVALGPALANGWLCFENKRQKRRLAPFPEDWERLTDAQLVALLERATPVVARVYGRIAE